MRRVPEYAGGHHEKMDETGYPNKLRGDQMSLPACIMAIADIFEALTAADHPYKKAKMLSDSMKILYFMKKDKHVDADLFELFLTSGAYKDYAEQFLRPEQVDVVNIEQYLDSKKHRPPRHRLRHNPRCRPPSSCAECYESALRQSSSRIAMVTASHQVPSRARLVWRSFPSIMNPARL